MLTSILMLKFCSLSAFTTSRFCSITLPLTPETHHLVSAKQFYVMKADAYLINAGRGAVVDEKH